MTVLVAALVGLAFDVEINPAAARIAIGGAKRGHGGVRRPIRFRRRFIDTHAREPSFAVEGAAQTGGQQDAVLRARSREPQIHARPIMRSADGLRVHVKWHGRHAERRADRYGRTVQVAHRDFLSANPARKLVAFADAKLNRRRPNRGIASRSGFDAHRLVVLIGDRTVRRAVAAQHCPAAIGVFKRTLKCRSRKKRRRDG